MANDAGAGGKGQTLDQVLYDRLSPAEAHSILYRTLTNLEGPWDLTPSTVHRLVPQMFVCTYAPGERILPQSIQDSRLGLVVEGQVAACADSSSGEPSDLVLLPGDTFGEATLVDGAASVGDWCALTGCEVWFLSRTQLPMVNQSQTVDRKVFLPYWLQVTVPVLLVLWLFLALLLTVPTTRHGVALVPAALGQWCQQESYDWCVEMAWRLAEALEPADSRPSLGLGILYFEQGQVAFAEQHLLAARAKAPDAPEVLNNLGLLYAHQQDHQRAIAEFQRAADLEPGNAAIEHNLGRSLQAIQAYDGALAHYRLALSLSAPRSTTWVNMALVYYEQAVYDQAASAARQALAIDPEMAAAHTVLGAVALEAQQPEQAVRHLLWATAIDDKDERAHTYLGVAYKSLQKPPEAILAFERALVLAENQTNRTMIRRYLNELYQAGR